MKFFSLAVVAAVLCVAVVSAAPSSDEEFDVMFDADEGGQDMDPSERLKCIVDAVAQALEKVKYDKVIEKLRKDIVVVDLRFKACQAEEDKWQERKCFRQAIMRAKEIFADMFRGISRENGKVYKRMRKYVKEQCYDAKPTPPPTPPPEKPPTEKPPTEKPPTKKPSTKKPSTKKPSTEKPSTKKPSTEKPSTEKPPTNPGK